MKRISQKYKEIFKLKEMLENAKIPFDFFSINDIEPQIEKVAPDFEHWHINYPSRKKCMISVVEGFGTYGWLDDKLEIMGGLTKEELEHNDVVGWLTAEEVFERIKKDYLGEMKMKKIVRYVDEDTLEIMEEIIDDDMTEEDMEDMIVKLLNCNPTEFIGKYNAYKIAEKQFNELYEPFKTKLINLYKDHPEMAHNIIMENIKLTYVSPSTKTIIDSKKLKEEEPAIAEKYSKISNVKASIRLSDKI